MTVLHTPRLRLEPLTDRHLDGLDAMNRLHPDVWRQGLASEAARAMATFAFQSLAAPELIAIRHPDNVASARVMDRLGMRYRGVETWYGKHTAVHVLAREEWERAVTAAG
jgi:RimJ/RimL family protein N-acetyltransferase